VTKRTIPDRNQKQIKEAINHCPGCTFIDTHDVPANLPELKGFPDGMVAIEDAFTIIADDPTAIEKVLSNIPGIKIIKGSFVPVEIKTETGKVRKSQSEWARKSGIESLVIRTIDEVFRLFR
jgi:hypothetical protein